MLWRGLLADSVALSSSFELEPEALEATRFPCCLFRLYQGLSLVIGWFLLNAATG